MEEGRGGEGRVRVTEEWDRGGGVDGLDIAEILSHMCSTP